jgi:RNA polymerase sigma-70 factor (ECF subfamily)
VPDRPGAWLAVVARNRALDLVRRAAVEVAVLERVQTMTPADETVAATAGGADAAVFGDDQLCLIFTCCHPALSLEARVALTLRSVAGLTSAEIARAFLVSERTMIQRLFRAKRKMRSAAIPFRVPRPDQLRERLDAVLAVLYLVFNEGYHASSGDELARVALCKDAIRLARLVLARLPDEPEVKGLLALMELHDARRIARTDANGDLVPLDEQHRDLWDHTRIAEAVELLHAALAHGCPGSYQIQAAIAACHATARGAADTDWVQIARLYAELARYAPGPIVELNRAVAVAMAGDLLGALGMVEALQSTDALSEYFLLPATHADILRRLGRFDEAGTAYRAALDLAVNEADRRALARRLDEIRPE